MPKTDEFTLLCETCGYPVEGLPPEGNCPECGRAIRSSLPEARKGTPWDRGPSLRSWLVTGWMVVRRPRQTFEKVRIVGGPLGSLFFCNAAVGALLAVGPLLLFIRTIGHVQPELGITDLSLAVLGPVSWAALTGLVVLLTSIERMGLRVIGRAHGWRITPAHTASVCTYASYGWAIAGAFLGAVSLTPLSVEARTLSNLLGTGWQLWSLSLYPVAALAGLLIFETLVYIGVRRCKFANRMRPSPAEPPTQPAA